MHAQDDTQGKLTRLNDDEARAFIEQFTKEDFQSAEGKPYAWLYQFKDNAFAFNRYRALLAEWARKQGERHFAAICKGYAEENKMSTPRTTEITQFGGQVMALRCEGYTCTDDGVVWNGGPNGFEEICPHPIMPVERLVNIETQEVKIRLGYQRRGRWNDLIVSKADLASARNIVGLASRGIGVTSESAKGLVRFLAHIEDKNYDDIPERKMVDRLGWIDGEGFSPFIDGVVYDENGQFTEEYRAIRTAGSYQAWLDFVRGVRKTAPIGTRIVLAASFASALVKKLDALPFLVHLWGSVSGIGKSVALVLAGSVWAYPEIGHYIKTTKATDVALEQLAFFAGNMPLCLDELQLIQSRKNFDEIIYALCEGTGKSRGAKTGGVQRMRRWCNTIITTGEQPVTTANSKAGAVNRVLEIECDSPTFGDGKDAAREAYQLLIHNYGFAGRDFVEKMQDTSETDWIAEARAAQKRHYDALEQYGAAHGSAATDKQTLMGSILMAADELAERLIFHDGVTLNAEEIQPYLVTRAESDTNRIAYEWLCEWIAQNPLKFRAQNDQYAGECWGKLECDANDNPVRACIIRSVFDRAMNEAGFNPASFLSWASKSGAIDRVGSKMTVGRRVVKGGPVVRCVLLVLHPDDDAGDPMAGMEPLDEQTKLPFD